MENVRVLSRLEQAWETVSAQVNISHHVRHGGQKGRDPLSATEKGGKGPGLRDGFVVQLRQRQVDWASYPGKEI